MDAFFDAAPPGRSRSALFAEDFDRPAQADDIPEPEVIAPCFSAADVAASRAEAWAEGHAAGTDEANATTTAAIRALLDSLGATLRETRDEAAGIAENVAEGIARLLMDSLSAMFPAFCARHGDAELAALMRRILPGLAREPAVTVRVNPAHIPALMRELDRLEPDFVERVQLVPVAAIPLGDVRATWRDGTATRDTASLWQQVREVLEPAGLLTPDPALTPTKETQHAG